jgi:hypothetical protein
LWIAARDPNSHAFAVMIGRQLQLVQEVGRSRAPTDMELVDWRKVINRGGLRRGTKVGKSLFDRINQTAVSIVFCDFFGIGQDTRPRSAPAARFEMLTKPSPLCVVARPLKCFSWVRIADGDAAANCPL